MIKTFVNINDTRWDAHKIDFAYIVNTVINSTRNKTLDVIQASDKVVFPWVRSAYGVRSFNDIDREVSIVLTDDSEIHELNKQYRNMDKPTNVLSFETGDDELLGDIIISYDTVLREAHEQNKSFVAHATHMVVHGVLHLLGYDHIDDNDANKMEALEVEILGKLKIKNPYETNEVVKKEKVKKSLFERFMPVWMILAGAISSFGFAPYYIGMATILGFIALYIFTYNRNGFWRGFKPGFWFGMGYGTLMFYWVLNSIFVDPIIAAQMRMWVIPGIIGIALASGLIFGLPAGLTAATGVRSWKRVVLFSAFWVFVLWLREWVFTGFPWNPIANITMPFPMIANSMSVWGAIGCSFVVLGLIFAIAHFLMEWRNPDTQKKQWPIPFCIFISLLIIGMGVGYINITKANEKVNVSPLFRIVQPAIGQSAKMSVQTATDNVNYLIQLSTIDTTDSPDVIIWPETSYPFMVVNEEFPPSRDIGKPVITGAMSYKNGRVYNSLVVADGLGHISNLYDKFHLVPFGEYQPFGKLVPSIGQLEFGSGPENIALRLSDNDTFNFVPAICYEIIFSDSLVPNGAMPDAIINVTNDTWFGTSHGPHQHLDMARRYAIESGLPIVRANYSGVSAFILSDGRVMARMEIGDTGIIDGTVWGAHITPYRIIGKNWMMIIILILATGIVTPKHGWRRKD